MPVTVRSDASIVEDRYHGVVLQTNTRYLFDDDRPIFSASVWEDGEIKTVSTISRAIVDATPDIKAAAYAFAYAHNYARILTNTIDADADRAHRIEKGASVEVISGRKIPVGTTATVLWEGESKFGWRTTYSALLLLNDGSKVYTSTFNLTRTDITLGDIDELLFAAANATSDVARFAAGMSAAEYNAFIASA
jgi:hypothetical protein